MLNSEAVVQLQRRGGGYKEFGLKLDFSYFFSFGGGGGGGVATLLVLIPFKNLADMGPNQPV